MRQWKDKASAAQPSALGLPKFNKLYPFIDARNLHSSIND